MEFTKHDKKGSTMATSMNFIRRVNKRNLYFLNQSFQIWWLISGIEVMKTHKISAQYL